MKTVGIQIKGQEIILVVLEEDQDGGIAQLSMSTRFGIEESHSNSQIKQFRNQVKATFDSIAADRVGIIARNYKTRNNSPGENRAPSPLSFKLEGIFQLYDGVDVEFIWPTSISALVKKSPPPLSPKYSYQSDAFNLAYYLLKK